MRQSAPRDAADRIRASLKIARAYTAIAVKEREAAIAMIRAASDGGGDGDATTWEPELAAIKRTFDDALSEEERIASRWRTVAGLPAPDAQIAALVRHAAAQAGLSKSGYAELCGVSPATASKHLTMLAELGLVQRVGQGPATRYRLSA